MREKYEAIVSITDEFAQHHLDGEYAELIRQATAALSRKRPSPLEKGKALSWACGITHAMGTVNFLFDRSQTIHMKASELYKAFGVSQGTGQSRSKAVRDALGTFPLDPNWSRPSRFDKNPLVWMVSVNGLMVDIRHMPRHIQELAYQQGIIPYIPADKEGGRTADEGNGNA